MTDGARTITLPVPRAGAVFVAAICAFLILFTLLAFQLRSGKDPALAAGAAAATPAKQVGAGKQSSPSPAPVTKTS